MFRVALIVALLATPAAAETFTIRCLREAPYYFTFDTDSKRTAGELLGSKDEVLFTYKGEIRSVSDDVIEFFLFAAKDHPSVFLYRKESRLGTKHDQELNSAFQCVPAATRTILSKWDMLN